MIRLRISLVVVALLFLVPVFGQEINIISQPGNKPVMNAVLEFRCLATDEVRSFMTNKDGIVVLPSDFSCTEFDLFITHPDFEDHLVKYTFSSTKAIEMFPRGKEMEEVVITAQYSSTSAEKAVQKIKVIDRKTIDLMGAQNLKDVLSNQMNIRISQDNVLGSSMSLQGISGQNVKILIDGVAVTGRVNGNIDISQINMNNVERIEIVEGPLSVNYGTDALAGTINIITKKFQKPSSSFSITSYYESNGQYNFSGRLAHSTPKYTFSLVGGRNYFDGWKYGDHAFLIDKVSPADSNRVKDWKPKEQYFGTAFIGRKIKNVNIGLSSDYFYEQIMNRGAPRMPYYETAFDDYYITNRFTNSLNISGKVRPNGNVNAIFAYNYYRRIKNTYIKDLTTLDQQLTPTPGDQDTSRFFNFTARGSYSTSYADTKLNGELGYDLQHETGTGIRIKNGNQQIGDYAIFGTAEYRPNQKLTIRPGFRLIYNTSYKAPIVPSVNVKQDIGKRSTVRLSYARGFRAPALKDLYFYFVDVNHNIQGNENLKAEYSHNFSASLATRFKTKEIQWKLDNSYFYNTIRNLITLAQLSGSATEYSYFNLSKFKSLGANVSLEGKWKNLVGTVGGSYVGRYNELSETYTSAPFTYSPEARLNLQYAWKATGCTLSVFYKYTGKTPNFALDANNQLYRTSIADYHMMDASIARYFWKKRTLLTIGGKNLFNVQNISGTASGSAHTTSSNTIPLAMGRTFFFKLDFNFTTKQK